MGRSRFAKLLVGVVLCLCSYLFFSRVVVTAVEVKGISMSPTLIPGDRLLLNKFVLLHREPQRGELVVLKDPETHELVVKRIVGMPCETVRIHKDEVFVNGRRLPEPYLSRHSEASLADLATRQCIPVNHYFVMGDNRNHSADSRQFGPVPRESILGLIKL